MQLIICGGLTLMLIGLTGSPAETRDIEPGQVWTYKDAAPPSSRVIVGRIDKELDGTTIVSISVTDAPIRTKEAPFQTISHLPFAEHVLQQSLQQKVGHTSVSSGFAEGYRLWREAYDNGEGGVFTISVAQAVQYVKQVAESQ